MNIDIISITSGLGLAVVGVMLGFNVKCRHGYGASVKILAAAAVLLFIAIFAFTESNLDGAFAGGILFISGAVALGAYWFLDHLPKMKPKDADVVFPPYQPRQLKDGRINMLT